MKYIILSLFLGAMFLGSCKDKCKGNLINEGGMCICPSGYFEVGDECRILGENEYFTEIDCIINESNYIEFKKESETLYKLLSRGPDRIVRGSGARIVNSTAEFDSIQSYNPDFMSSLGYFLEQIEHNNQCCLVAFVEGRLYEDRFSGSMVWRIFPTGEIYERCPMEMVR